ncbi:hypothetical protein EAF00_009556 [Botryotinia globosa]|nr:hypothetical protein EAF00_009556 [Botryotinia globosa]
MGRHAESTDDRSRWEIFVYNTKFRVRSKTSKTSDRDFLSISTSYFGAGYDNVIKNRLEGFYWERLEYRKSLVDDAKSSLPLRDMISALSGIAKRPKGTQPFTISYEKSPRQVYSELVNYLIETDKNYDVLSHAEQYSNHVYHTVPSWMPSWAPDWTIRAKDKQKIVDWVETLDKARNAVSNSAYLEDQGFLACAGYKIGMINLITDSPRDIQHSDEGRADSIDEYEVWKRLESLENIAASLSLVE